MPWGFRYVQGVKVMQDRQFPSKREAMAYAEREFAQWIRAPNNSWESLARNGVAWLDNEGLVTIFDLENENPPENFNPKPTDNELSKD